MKRISREKFEYILSKLAIGETWTVQTMTEHGAAGGGYQLRRAEHDGLIYCNGFAPFPTGDGSNDGVMWDYFTQTLKRWPRAKTPSFAYGFTEMKDERRIKDDVLNEIRSANGWLTDMEDIARRTDE